MKIKFKKFVILIFFFVASNLSYAADNEISEYDYLKFLGESIEKIKSDYVEHVDNKEIVESAINGILSSLDPHSSFLNAKSLNDMKVQTKGEFGGLGIEVTMENGFVKVISPIDNTPAYKAGVKSGDYITHLDKTSVIGLTLDEAVGKMRGPIGSKIKITIGRKNQEPFDLVIKRDVIKITSVRSRLEKDVGYVRITTFSEQTNKSTKEAVKKILKNKNLKGFVLDLRNNPGGLLEQAVAISDLFLEQGEIVSTRGRDSENPETYKAKPGDVINGLPLVVLINSGSASASEIVAGALQDHKRAIILGTQSFGKGSVQTIIPVNPFGALRMTTAKYFTPSGRSIQKKGIAPDIIVEAAKVEKIDGNIGGREADLKGALDNPNQELKNNEDSKNAEESIVDFQLSRALDLVRGISLYKKKLATN
ncbi:MAG: Carboxy-terminal processing protease CtpA [Alphaproteobacteria bacterium MarineAlpha6_Bin3]|nr:MAG: Carboxy-terminal processing protease CtpA [Alphaproteobacteria bacterium MarineAlpha6_Bin3]|tara:strand:- start:9420 stop:10685 length:1266 start_codon:yes stop_codon:yes gene_type:complete